MVRPKSNLPPEAQPWGRAVEDELDAAGRSLDAGSSAVLNNNKAVNATLAQIAAQIASINAIAAAQASQLATLTAQQGQINSALADLTARKTVTNSISTFNTGSLPNDFVDRPYGSSIPITISVPTGKLVVTIGCGEASLAVSGAGSAVIAYATFSIPGYANMLDYTARVYLSGGGQNVGASLCLQQAFTVTPGTYTITGQMYATAATATGQSVNFRQPYLTVQVTG